MKTQICFYVLLFIYVVHSAKDCKRDLVVSHGLQGLYYAQNMVLEMCPNIRETCCRKSDQKEIYANWIHSDEKAKVKKHYIKVTKVYQELTSQLVDTFKVAQAIHKKLKYKKIANCKVLAERIMVFDITSLEEKIHDNLRKMEDFFIDSYQGFYCTICNYEYHQFFTTEKVIFSEKFCRDVVENTLPVLLFFHSNIVKYSNLVSKFLVSCDHKGDYMADVKIPKEYLFIIDEKIEKDLRGCTVERNS